MVTIESSTLRQNIYETVYDALTSANLLSGAVTVTAAYIDDDAKFPQVIIYPVSVSKDGFTYNRSFGREEVNVSIEIYTKKAKDLDQINDELVPIMQGLKMNSLQLTNIDEDIGLFTDNNNKIHQKMLGFRYFRGR